RLALQVLDRSDIVSCSHAVGAVALVELKDLLRSTTIGIPGNPGFDGGRRALDVARRDGQMAIFLRNLLDRHVKAVLLENAGLVGERERRKAGPSGDPDADLHVVGNGWCGDQESGSCGEYSKTKHGCIP